MIVKICGLTRRVDIEHAVAAGADALGVVLAPSPRRVRLESLPVLLAGLPKRIPVLAVFRMPTRDDVAALDGLPISGVQGDATWDGRGLPERCFFLPVFNDGPDLVDRVTGSGLIGAGLGPQARSLTGAFLVDGPRGGGMGEPVDVGRAATAARLGRMMLAGGLRPENVAGRIREIRPLGVDVSSGVEAIPAEKDPTRVTAFIQQSREAEG